MAIAALEAAQTSTDRGLIKEVDTLLAKARDDAKGAGAPEHIQKLLDELLSEQRILEAERDAHVQQDVLQRAQVNTLAREGKRLWNAFERA